MATSKIDIVDSIISYESGEMDTPTMIRFFAELVRTGQAWSLQGSYGRGAKALIDAGFISSTGEVNEGALEQFNEEV